MRSYICKATSKDFNNLKLMKEKQSINSNLELGLSTLHAWIRFFEYFLHVGYKLGTQKWRSGKSNVNNDVEKRKRTIQNAFKSQLALIIDQPKVGFGNSNDGNTARRFFENYSVSARILGVDENLIKRAYIILQTLSSGFAVNVDVFQQYCFETAEICVALYSWYYMPTAVHKILIHGSSIIEWSPLPIGQMSEDAQEARNKEIRQYRERFARKSSRTVTMQDVFNCPLVTSDPFISSMGKNHPKRTKTLSPEVVQMLIGTEIEIYGINNCILSSTDDDESTDVSDE